MPSEEARGEEEERKREKGKEEGGDWEPKILAFCCNWCSYAGADAAGLERRQMPPTFRVVRVMCSGRIDPAFVLLGLLEGADAVLMTGCHFGDCHYIDGNYKARNRYEFLKEFVDELGLEPERIGLRWISASEGPIFAEMVREVTENVKKVGPSPFRRRWKK
ncbi:MAG: hydrogenase iron-sulfur subunit [Candidatus Methanospirare jalkutatii]|nr:hydrogenase iron-sulfur subunit [Candidatus Methanospirare jalkutatii]MCW7079261.1 hydrogenase iron-sulfur subunit [Candidatus Methanoxibalbensis ujae]MCW7080293.1 hydrogenase iron-sulfur subunit [Candidatus Methanospirare jalkutatii]